MNARRVAPVLATGMLLAVGLGCAPVPTEPTFLGPPVFGERDSVFTDNQLKNAAYSSYKVPPGFYDDGPVTLRPYYASTVTIADPQHPPTYPWTEFATEDTSQARAWAEATVAYLSETYPLSPAPPVATERYFQFDPVPEAGGTQPSIRVHRASYVSGISWTSPDSSGTLGAFQQRPVSSSNALLLAEYLWTLSHSGFKVLSVFPIETPGEVDVVMFEERIWYGDYGMRDRIQLVRVDYRIDKITGNIRYVPASIREILGQKR